MRKTANKDFIAGRKFRCSKIINSVPEEIDAGIV